MDPDLITHSKIWFDDGSVVIQAEQTQFRVHRGMLSRQSSIFRDMFSVPQPPGDQEPVIEGCSIVHVSESSQDWEGLLTLMYDNLRVYGSDDPMPISLIAVMLRLGKKYDMEHFLKEAVTRLQYEFPRNLSDWDLISDQPFSKLAQSGDSMSLDIIILAQEAGIQSILPLAYLFFFNNGDSMEKVYSTYEMEYGTTATAPPDVQKILVLGREKLLRGTVCNTYGWLADDKLIPHTSCKRPKFCAATRLKLLLKVCVPIPDVNFALARWDKAQHAADLCVGKFFGRSCLPASAFLIGKISRIRRPNPHIDFRNRLILVTNSWQSAPRLKIDLPYDHAHSYLSVSYSLQQPFVQMTASLSGHHKERPITHSNIHNRLGSPKHTVCQTSST
ncbi:uncharacterized protein LACBIDRAFT_333017 [Laccaria bicolor S238N-H82]|uniref:Predicted protein n=1 Tax=Laccaria bicolor (strain S238N-H82 / ATCC MYA-4686) TaxID=486041 RepID=B0DUK3_LACBS|nr:uncharacterized protein LACBIDRAFT_333017 [Laccaria bicolor S238N-H82]EDR01758.1 predicted protein [Laccaria bicolor S238N-H82]|eukprot:XP_001887571.1 predicted protein [Laccaria bicolor S238N-H82]